jgi:hypothetical protein
MRIKSFLKARRRIHVEGLMSTAEGEATGVSRKLRRRNSYKQQYFIDQVLAIYDAFPGARPWESAGMYGCVFACLRAVIEPNESTMPMHRYLCVNECMLIHLCVNE